MCGIVSFLGFNNKKTINKILLKKMNECHTARGPDFGGETLLNKDRFGLAHRRLSIIDLDPRSNQPFATQDKKHWIVYNGEIYNFLELKKELIGKGVVFRTTSDTEVLLWMLVKYQEEALQKIEGMFAFVYLNIADNYAIAARDRLGIKPLSFMKKKDYIAFSSTITPLTFLPDFAGEIDELARFEMLTSKYVPAPASIYKEIRKILPGELLKIDLDNGNLKKIQYWTPASYLNNYKFSENDLLDKLDDTITRSVKRQMIADVPIGTFLSGGVDSSLVTAVMQKVSQNKINSFCVGFNVKKYDESVWAAKIAEHLGTKHKTFFVTPENIIDTLKTITNIYDEPFGDSSSIPSYLLSRYVVKKVKVILSGDGGDEQFFGYTRYSNIKKYYSLSRFFPKIFRKLLYSLTDKNPRSFLCHAVSALGAYKDKSSLYTHYNLENFSALSELSGAGDRKKLFKSNLYNKNIMGYDYAGKDIFKGMMLGDILLYLPDDCLTKVDRASMAHSLEVRVPLLDENVLRLSLNIPLKYKIKNGEKKYILKKLLTRYIPEQLVYRPKMGFGVPLDRWLFNELNDFTSDLLSKNNILKAGLDPEGINKIIDHHKSGKYDHQYFLWPLCAYISWYLYNRKS